MLTCNNSPAFPHAVGSIKSVFFFGELCFLFLIKEFQVGFNGRGGGSGGVGGQRRMQQGGVQPEHTPEPLYFQVLSAHKHTHAASGVSWCAV